MLRLRKRDGKFELGFKNLVSKEKAKIMEEFQVTVDDFDAMKDVFLNLGLKVILKFAKHRTSYLLDGVHFEIDTFEGIPALLEIEASNLKVIGKYVKKLGFSMKDAKPWSTDDVINHYKNMKK